MNRRKFNAAFGMAAAGVLAGRDQRDRPRLAITMDDPNIVETPLLSAEERNQRILDALRNHRSLKAALFVCGQRINNDRGRAIVRAWDTAGHTIGNHSYSHLYYNSGKTDFETYSRDFLQGEAVISELPRFTRIFRFPFLKEGEIREKRDRMRSFLANRGYAVGHVSVDTSDWYVSQRLEARLKKDSRAATAAYRDYYIDHILGRLNYYNDLAEKISGRQVSHVLLTHHNLLNALFLSDLLKAIEGKGWSLIDAAEAFKDPIYRSAPDIVPAGESIVWALAKESGRFNAVLRYPGEDGEYEKAKMDALGL